MSWMSSGMQMQTVGGSVGKALGRMFSGEALFQNKYTASSTGDYIAFLLQVFLVKLSRWI